MSVTRTQMETKVRRRLADKTTRRDGTTISNPFYPAADIQAAINDCLRERQPDIIAKDRSFYASETDYIGITDAVSATSNQQYALPSGFRDWLRLVRSDLAYFPTVRKVERAYLDTCTYENGYLFAGDQQLSDRELCALHTNMSSNARQNRIRILPAPTAVSMTYRLFYLRVPTEPSSDSHELDMPDEWAEVIALDTALYLAATGNEEVADRLEHQRDIALATRMNDNGSRDAGRLTLREVRF